MARATPIGCARRPKRPGRPPAQSETPSLPAARLAQPENADPGLLLLHPDTAQTLLDYRTARLPGAREKAGSYSPPFGGAMFPWESALTGEETCPTWAATGLREIHINGDIAVAVWAMWRSLGGDNGGLFLNATAWPLLSGIADFWMSKLALDNPGAPPGAPLSLHLSLIHI